MSKKEQVLIIEPPIDLTFTGTFTQIVYSYMKVKNPSDRKVCFKVQTTAPTRYCVKPTSGVVDPNTEVAIEVSLMPFEYDPAENYKHKLMVLYRFAPDGEINQDTLWEEIDQNDLKKSKLRCVFAMPTNQVEDFSELDAIVANSESDIYNVPMICSMIKTLFSTNSVWEALSKCRGEVEEEVILMILNLLNSELADKIKKMWNIPLHSFRSPHDILRYVIALIKSGVSKNTHQGIMFVMGNTGAGKTSLVHNLKSYMKDPSKPLEQFLTENNSEFRETQILEIYKDISLEQNSIGLKVDAQKESPHIKNVKFQEESSPPSVQNMKINVVDFGGHHEYNACSSLFLAGSGICFICFDISKDHDNIKIKHMNEDQFEEVYFSNIGNYVDMISKIACQFGIQPKLVLVGTKVDSKDKEHEHIFKIALNLAKEQLENLDGIFSEKQSVLLIDEVIATSSTSDDKEKMEELVQKVASLYYNQDLMGQKRVSIPHSWYTILENLRRKGKGSLSIEEIKQAFADIPHETSKQVNLSPNSLENLERLKTILIEMDKVFKSHEQKEKNVSGTDADQTVEIDTFFESQTETNNSVGDTDIDIIDLNDQFSTQKERVADEVQASLMDEDIAKILDFFTALGEVLWFKQIESLKNSVIPDPMDLIKALRTVINHKFEKYLKNREAMREELKDIMERGILSFKVMKFVYNKQISKLAFTAEEIWVFLIQLGLGCKLDDEDLTDGSLIFLPCLIGDKRKKFLLKQEENMLKDDSSICIQFSLDVNKQGLGMYYDVISILTRNFIYGDRGRGRFIGAFSEKIENRKLGNVGGIYGSMKWTERDIRCPENYNFLLLEYDTDLNKNKIDTKFIPTLHKVVRFHLQRTDAELTIGILEVLCKLDELIKKVVPNATRRLLCDKCEIKDQGYFKVDEEFLPTSECCDGEGPWHQIYEQNLHKVLEEFKSRMVKPFDLEELMNRDREELGLELFEHSDIRKKMQAGELGVGEQIWIYRDRTTSWNPIAYINPYSHVVVYVGKNEDKHEVVHVKKELTEVKIAKEDVNEVIKPGDQVFLGHRIIGCQFSGNIRQRIKDRALACVAPKIVFDYDYRNNCETFCNLVLFGKNHSTQSRPTRSCIKIFFKCYNILKYPSSFWLGALPLREQIEKRFIERGLMEPNNEDAHPPQHSHNYLYGLILLLLAPLIAYVLPWIHEIFQ